MTNYFVNFHTTASNDFNTYVIIYSIVNINDTLSSHLLTENVLAYIISKASPYFMVISFIIYPPLTLSIPEGRVRQ